MLFALLLAVFPLQDDFSHWLGRLESESIEERDEASRRLQAFGVEVVGRLEKAREATKDAAVRARIDAILAGIRRTADLVKFLKPTRRVTIAARGRPLKEVLSELKAPRIKGINAGMLDVEARIDFQVRNVSWWEAVDRLARALKARYVISWEGDDYEIQLKPGLAPESPVAYLEQFRISVAESKRLDYRTPAGNFEGALVAVEVRHQADLRPASQQLETYVRITSVLDAKDGEARIEPPEEVWTTDGPLLLSLQGLAWVKPDAVGPFTVSGTTDIPFASESREIRLDLAGDRTAAEVGKVRLSVEDVSVTASGLRLNLRATAEDTPFLYERFNPFGGLVLIDGAGRRHKGSHDTSMSSEDACRWGYAFSTGIEKPIRIEFQWVAEFHRVQIPFRLEGVRLPDRSK